MDANAFAKAKARLERMARSITDIEAATTYAEVADAWERFIFAASTFYSALQQGAKSNGAANAWFGRMKHERRIDPLLQYVHQARNAEEHGIAPITSPTNSKIHLTEKDSEVTLRSNGRSWDVISQSGAVLYPMERAKLATVRDDRYHDSFDPPQTHLGAPILDQSPLGVARLAQAHLISVLKQAERFL